MGGIRNTLIVVGMSLVGLGVALGVTNPSSATYEAFALKELNRYLKSEVCSKELPLVGKSLKDECLDLVDSNQTMLRTIITENTDRQNYVLFSLYTTKLAPRELFPFIPSGLLPTYQVKTVGGLQTFYIYEAKEKK